jgi:threonine synthase
VNFVQCLQRVFCGRKYPARNYFTCPACGISGILDVQFDYGSLAGSLTRERLAARQDWSQWRYRELLPLQAHTVLPPLSVGWTPLTPAPTLAREIGIRALFLKDDGRNATGSLKDRASALAAAKARDKKQRIVACASPGNAASSCAGMAASLGLRSVIFVPEQAPESEIIQLLIFGATVVRVHGHYEQAFELCQRACERWRWYNRNCAVNPYLVEGKKTVGLEIGEQMGWQAPDWVAVSVGDGCTIAGVWKAFREMKILGLIDRTPRMLGVQVEGAAPVTAAFHHGGVLRPVKPNSAVDAIAIGAPRNWKKAILAAQESRGAMINVTDGLIFDAMRYTGRLTGIFAEPAAAAAVAGLRRAVAEDIIGRRESAVAVITGNGLKDVKSARSAVGKPFEIGPDGDGLEEVVSRQRLAS